MTKTVSHVDALFGGRRVRFELYRDRATVEAFERDMGSANAAWGRFVSGTYTVSDVRSVLALSHPGETQWARVSIAGLHRLTDRVPARPSIPCGVPPETLDGILAGRPLATYAGLAELVMTAWLIGLPPFLSRFDEAKSLNGAIEAYIAERARQIEAEGAAA